MGISKGTRLTETPKDITYKIRYDADTAEKLSVIEKETGKTRAEIFRHGVDIQYETIKK